MEASVDGYRRACLSPVHIPWTGLCSVGTECMCLASNKRITVSIAATFMFLVKAFACLVVNSFTATRPTETVRATATRMMYW